VRALSLVLVSLELVVAASALQRLRLYEREFGLTELRLYASGIVLWLVCCFVWLALTTLRGRGRFAVGALVLAFAATATLNVVSPDALIARTNLARPHVDSAYLSRPSDDAVPVLVSRLRRCDRRCAPSSRGGCWRSGRAEAAGRRGTRRARAASLLRRHHAELLVLAR
jgi:hypothetical protein